MKKAYTLFAGLGLFFVMALRDSSVGTDTNSYLRLFNSISHLNNGSGEYGFYYLEKFLGVLGLSDQMYLAVISAIITISFSVFFY